MTYPNINLTPEVINQIIAKVADIHKGKTFDYHDEDDIEQQVWIIAIEALPKYECKKVKAKNAELAFESWLNAVVSKRLKNFYRDRYTVKHREKTTDSEFDKLTRYNLSRPLEITVAETTVGQEDVIFSDLTTFNELLLELPPDLREVFLLQKSGINITGYYADRLKKKIIEIYEAKTNQQHDA